MLMFELGLICCYVDYLLSDTINVTFLRVKEG